MSIFLGKIICVPDAADAAERDEAFFSGNVPPMPDFPQLTDGLLHRDRSGRLSLGAGLLSPHVDIRRAGATGRFDDLVGKGFALVCAGSNPDDLLDAATRDALDRLGVNIVLLNQPEAPGNAVDLDGRLTRFMQDHHWQAMFVRPDYYVYGGAASSDDLPSLVADFLADLREAGVKLAEAHLELEPTK